MQYVCWSELLIINKLNVLDRYFIFVRQHKISKFTMYKKGLPVLKQFVVYICFFILMKIVFVFYHLSYFDDLNLSTLLQIIRAGFPLDITMASYMVAFPLVLRLVDVFVPHKSILYILKGYTLITSVILSVLFIVDLQLYSYWGFRLDSTPVFYFMSSPSSAMASATMREYLLGFIGTPILILTLYYSISKVCLKESYWIGFTQRRISQSVVLLFAMGLCFLGIRGGWTVSTMNLSRAYFSTDERLNHAAINPVFSFMESMLKDKDFSKQYQYFEVSKVDELLGELNAFNDSDVVTDKSISTDVLKSNRPDVFLVILESFSIPLMEMKSSDGREITPNLNRLSRESVFFTNFYANSFRTDRGLVSILSGFPAQPNSSIMKYPRKAQGLPMISNSLKDAGYKLHYFYGGDINFTNQNAYLRNGGYDETTSDKDFPIAQKLSKWGVNDEFVFQEAIETLKTEDQSVPLFYTIQTSTSHEPFDAPVDIFEKNKENAFAYTDKCIGEFLAELKLSGRWDNSLVVFVADHQGGLPEGLPNNSLTRYHIPMIWTGGAISSPQEVEILGSQIDIAATLLAQMRISHEEYMFSKDLFNPHISHYGYFAFPGLVGLWNEKDGVVLNLQTDEAKLVGEKKEPMLSYTKALLQKIYLTMSKL